MTVLLAAGLTAGALQLDFGSQKVFGFGAELGWLGLLAVGVPGLRGLGP